MIQNLIGSRLRSRSMGVIQVNFFTATEDKKHSFVQAENGGEWRLKRQRKRNCNNRTKHNTHTFFPSFLQLYTFPLYIAFFLPHYAVPLLPCEPLNRADSLLELFVIFTLKTKHLPSTLNFFTPLIQSGPSTDVVLYTL